MLFACVLFVVEKYTYIYHVNLFCDYLRINYLKRVERWQTVANGSKRNRADCVTYFFVFLLFFFCVLFFGFLFLFVLPPTDFVRFCSWGFSR